MRSTIAAIATPPGRGGIGIIRISGPHAFAMAAELCGSGTAFEHRTIRLTNWLDEDGRIIDSGLTLAFTGPNSYTGEDVVELQGHGSPVLLQLLMTRLFALGAVAAQPGEFTRRAVENNKMDLSQAEAVIACIDAATERAARQAQRHLQGDFGHAISGLMDRLIGIVAHIEACLDFPEEEIPALFMDELGQRMTETVLNPLNEMLATSGFGERLFDGAVVAIIGAPNVGKSSLLNALSGRDRAIVSDTPGTTRDVLEIDFEVHGIPVRLADTAGIRESDDHIEQEGVRRAHEAAAVADLVVFVADAARPETWLMDRLCDLRVMNKCDMLDPASLPDGFLQISVRKNDGIEALRDRLAVLLGEETVGEESLLVTRARHRRALEQVKQSIEAGMAQLGDESQMDLVALEWRRAWAALGEILGLGDVEVILDRVFSEFCIGK